MRDQYLELLDKLNKDMIEMGALCEEIIGLAAKALYEGDKELAKTIAAIGSEIDQKEKVIEAMCLRLILRQQPVAGDLREISAALKMITDMERIGDQAEDIAEIITYMEAKSSENEALMYEMAESAKKMVNESIDAFVSHDIELAQKVIGEDDIVDEYFDRVKSALVEAITEKTINGEDALDLLMIAKYFERIGDHAVNIAEWVIYSVTGVHKSV